MAEKACYSFSGRRDISHMRANYFRHTILSEIKKPPAPAVCNNVRVRLFFDAHWCYRQAFAGKEEPIRVGEN